MLNKMVFRFLILGLFLLSTNRLLGQTSFKAGIVAFYNLENLFDTIDTPNVKDTEFSSLGDKKWTGKKYWIKIANMAKVISKIGIDEGVPGPAILGVSEIENQSVLEDLIRSPQIKALNYQIVHYNSPDKRGVDVALLYQPKYFTYQNSTSNRLNVFKEKSGDTLFTRDQLVVSGLFDGEPMHFIVNHWPSRYGGSKRSAPNRIAAAQLSRHLVDSIRNIDLNAKIIVMGDFNDEPTDVSIKKHLNTSGKKDQINSGQLYNPMEALFKKGIGSLAYRDQRNLFDQIIITPPLLKASDDGYYFHKAGVFSKSFMLEREGRYKGYPYRTFVGNSFKGGYSDHLPAYIMLVKKVK